MSASSHPVLDAPSSPGLPQSWFQKRLASAKGPLAAAFAALVLFTWAYWSAVKELISAWNSNPDYSHGYLVVPVCGWLLWKRRDSYPLDQSSAGWGGLGLIALAGLLRLASARFYLPEVDGWSIPLWLGGVCWLAGGRPVFKWAAPALGFLYFMVPLPATIELLLSRPLQLISTGASTWLLQCLGQPALAEGTTILLGEHVLEVERACSGLRMFYGVCALAVAFVMLRRPHWRTALILLGCAAPVAVLANTARVTATGLMYRFASSDAAQRFSHDFAGLLTIPLAVGLFGTVLYSLERFDRQILISRSRAMLNLTMCLVAVAVVVPLSVFWHAFVQDRNQNVLLAHASSFEQQADWSAAADYLDRYLRLRPHESEIRIRLAHAVDRSARTPAAQARALSLFAEAHAAFPDRAELGLKEAELALQLGQFARAIEICDRFFASDASSGGDKRMQPQAARIRALALFGRASAQPSLDSPEQWEPVVQALEQAVGLDPSELDLSVRLANVYRRRKVASSERDPADEADVVIDRMVESNKDNPAAWLARYRYRRQYETTAAGHSEDAAGIDADLDRAIELLPPQPDEQSLEVLLAAADRALARNELSQSRSYYEQAAIAGPADFRAYLRLGELALTESDDKGRTAAVAVWRRGLKNVGRFEVALVLPLAEVLIELGRFDEADAQLRPLERSLERLPEPAQSSVGLGVRRVRAKAEAAVGRLREAIAILSRALGDPAIGGMPGSFDPQLAAAWAQLGDYYQLLQLSDQAASAYQRAAGLDAASFEFAWKAAVSFQQAGRLDESLAYFSHVVVTDESRSEAAVALARVSLLQQLRYPAGSRNWEPYRRALELAKQRGADATDLALLEVDFAVADGRPEQGLSILEQSLSKFPDSSRLWQAMATLEQSSGSLDEAQRALQEFERSTDDPLHAALLKGAVLARAGKFDEARQTLSAAFENVEAGQRFQLRYQLAQLELQRGERQSARQQLEQLLPESPAPLLLAEELAQLAWEDRDWPAVERFEEQLRELEGPEGTMWRVFRARRLLDRSGDVDNPDFQEAVRLQREILRRRPSWSETYVLQGQIARRQRRLRDAVDAYTRAERFGDRSIALSEELIDLLLEQRRFTEADRYLNRVQDYITRSSRLSTAAIPLFVRRGEPEQALELAREWVRRQPDNPEHHLRLGRTLLITSFQGSDATDEAIAEAERAFQKSVELGPSDIRTWVALFRFYVRYRQDESAALGTLEEFAEQLQIPASARSFVLAQLYESVGRRADAARFYREAAESAPEQVRLGVLERAAGFFAATGRMPLAEQYARSALQLAPDSTRARLLLARLLTSQGGQDRLDEAQELLHSLGERSESSDDVRRARVAVLIRRGDWPAEQQALELLEDLVRIPQRSEPSDRLQLSALYEGQERILPAYEQLWALARQDDADPAHLVAFIEFLTRHIDAYPQYAARAERTLGRLESRAETELLALKLRLELLASAERDPAARRERARQAVDLLLQRRVRAGDAEADAAVHPGKRQLLLELAVLLLRNDLDDEVLRLGAMTPPPLPPEELAVCLATAGTAVPQSSGWWESADPMLTSTLNSHPDNIELLFALGNFRYVQRRQEDAIDLYQRLLAIEPEHMMARNNLALCLADTSGRLDEAEKTITGVIKSFGREPLLLDTRAVVLLRQGRLQEARELLQEALDSGGAAGVYLLHLAYVHHLSDDADAARHAFRQAVDLNVAEAVVTPIDRRIYQELDTAFGGAEASHPGDSG